MTDSGLRLVDLPLLLPRMPPPTSAVQFLQDFSPAQWPGLPDPSHPTYANYSEHLLVGYRYYDAKQIKFTTGFPFGHGLLLDPVFVASVGVCCRRCLGCMHLASRRVLPSKWRRL